MSSDAKLDAVRAYLAETFTDADVARAEDRGQGAELTVHTAGKCYALIVDRGFLEPRSTEDIRRTLIKWNVHSELCRAEGMPMMITDQGVRLASSN